MVETGNSDFDGDLSHTIRQVWKKKLVNWFQPRLILRFRPDNVPTASLDETQPVHGVSELYVFWHDI